MRRPGTRLRALAQRFCSAPAMERLIDPLIADLQHECDQATGRGQDWRRRWIRAVGCLSFIKVLAAASWLELARDGAPDDRRSFGRAVLFSVVAIVAFSAVLVWPPLRVLHGTTRLAALTLLWCLVPQALAVAIPLGVLFGVLLGLRNRAITPHVRWNVAVAAAVCSVATLVIIGWIMPASNQTFRERAAGRPLARGMNELTLREIAFGDPSSLGAASPDASRRLAYELHARLALAAAPLALGLFAIGVSAAVRRTFSAVTVGVAAFLWALGYYTVMSTAREQIYHGAWLPPAVAGWAANAVIVAMTLAVFRRIRISRDATGTTV